jgi:hypothetical protein
MKGNVMKIKTSELTGAALDWAVAKQFIFEEIKYTVGAWALPYLVNGDASGLEDGEQEQIDEWLREATASWRDTDDNLWVFAHESVDTDSHDEFARDDITGLHGSVYTVSMMFRRGN